MDPAVAQTLRSLMETQRIAALGTLHQGEPYVSMTPFALLPDGSGLVIHVSHLAAHTRDMMESPKVSLLVIAPQNPETPPQAVARATIQGDAVQCLDSEPEYGMARMAYLDRFPQSEPMFELTDFSLFVIRPRSIRVVGGFAQAKTVTPEGFAKALAAA